MTEAKMRTFQFQIADELQSVKRPGGWNRADVASAVLKHARTFSPEQTALTLQRVAGWKTFENIGPEKYGAVIAHLCYEMTKRTAFVPGQALIEKSPVPKTKGNS